MLESYIFRHISAKFLPKTKAALLWRLILEWAVLLFMKSSRINILCVQTSYSFEPCKRYTSQERKSVIQP